MKHHVVDARGIRIHCVEEGSGPLVLMVHGFPESWYSWRHQIPALAEAGYRAVAIDVRGYGRSGSPIEVDAYGMLQHVNDNVGVVEALLRDSGSPATATIIGHDWGSPIAAHSALLRPDMFTAVAMLSVPYSPPGFRRPTAVFAEMAQAAGPDEEFYINYFQEPGRAEAEIEADVAGWLRGFYLGASGEGQGRSGAAAGMATVHHGGQLKDRFPVDMDLPDWLSPEDLEFYIGEFERTGFRGPLNRYRNVDRDWSDLQAWRGRPITVPSIFIGGEKDGPTLWGGASIKRFPDTLPRLHSTHILPGCGHWVQQERAADVTGILLDWLGSL